MQRLKNKHGQFVADEANQAMPWKAKDQKAYAALLEKYPALKTMKAVLEMIGQGKTKTAELIKAGLFPRPCMYGPKRWREADVRAWINEKAEAV